MAASDHGDEDDGFLERDLETLMEGGDLDALMEESLLEQQTSESGGASFELAPAPAATANDPSVDAEATDTGTSCTMTAPEQARSNSVEAKSAGVDATVADVSRSVTADDGFRDGGVSSCAPAGVDEPSVPAAASGHDVRHAGAATGAPEELPDEDELFGSEAEPEATQPAPTAAAAGASAPPAPAAASPQSHVPPPPPPYSPTTQESRQEPVGGAAFVDESRYFRDQNGALQHKWKVDYAPRGGGGRAQCRDNECLFRFDQAGVRTIEKGCLRIGRRMLVEQDDKSDGAIMTLWYHARCIFNTFTRARKNTRIIETAEDLEGFEKISFPDQDMLRKFMSGQEDFRKARGGPPGGPYGLTPEKRGAEREPAESREAKKVKRLLAEMALKKGDRVWTHCRVRPKDPAPDRPGAMVEIATKSAKPELGMIREEVKDGHLIIQFESAEHEKERIELFNNRKKKRIQAWNRYPRIFEGKKQRIPLTWIVQNRTPPRLCSCIKQDWSHECQGCDGAISCGRGTVSKVFGVAQ